MVWQRQARSRQDSDIMDIKQLIQGRTFTKEEAIELIKIILIRTPDRVGPEMTVLLRSDGR
jgi:hypothetical protein